MNYSSIMLNKPPERLVDWGPGKSPPKSSSWSCFLKYYIRINNNNENKKEKKKKKDSETVDYNV